MSGYKCGGLVYTSDTLMTTMASEGEDMSSIDPNGLLLTKDKEGRDFDGLSATEALKQKEDGTVAWEDLTKVCKEWGEAIGKAFCCQAFSGNGYFGYEAITIFDATKVEKQDPVKLDFGEEGEMELIYYAEIMGAADNMGADGNMGAAGKLGVLTTLVATMVFMN